MKIRPITKNPITSYIMPDDFNFIQESILSIDEVDTFVSSVQNNIEDGIENNKKTGMMSWLKKKIKR